MNNDVDEPDWVSRDDVWQREVQMQSAWSRIPAGSTFTLVDGRALTLLSCGTWNTEAGPDFLNARIVIDGTERTGDIELHRESADYFRHGHDRDNWYDFVVLHVVQHYDPTRAPAWPTLLFSPQSAAEHHVPTLGGDSLFPWVAPGDCAPHLARIPDALLLALLEGAGEERFFLKSELFLRLITAAGSEFALLYGLFDAAGYKANRAPFLRLFDRLNSLEKWHKPDFEAFAWGESGLLPDPSQQDLTPEMAAFCEKIWSDYGIRRDDYAPQIPFVFNRSRPCNRPERRLAALLFFLRAHAPDLPGFLFDVLRSTPDPQHLARRLQEVFTCSDPLWDRYYSFQTPAPAPLQIQGRARALEIVLNIVLPWAHACGRIQSDAVLEHMSLKAFKLLPAMNSNGILKNAGARCFGKEGAARLGRLLKTAARQQGLMHVFLNFCELNQTVCARCRFLRAAEEIPVSHDS